MNWLFRKILPCLLLANLLLPVQGFAQESEDSKLFSKEQIAQLVAPIALYPDPLLAQILMASTYPLEVVSASRWVKNNENLKESALKEALQEQTWDESVKSLTAFPQVLEMLNEKLDMTQKLGDAFLAQQKEVMDSVQTLRSSAQEADNLKTTNEQIVTTKQENDHTVIVIQAADPEVIYVPSYDPSHIYGEWPYPTYAPYSYYPPGYVPGTALFSFGVGLAVGGALWGDFNWGHGDVNINVNRYNNFNQTNIKSGNWQHQAEHRKGAPYRDQHSQKKYGKDRKGTESREKFRGRAEQGRQELARGGRDTAKHDSNKRGDRKSNAHQKRDKHNKNKQRSRNNAGKRSSHAFDGINHGGRSKHHSQRGQSSRSSSMNRGHNRSSGAHCGGHRGGGGAHRGGGRRR